ncbi:hypothetical protein GCM10027168_68830 [Streptomyces capparidis]
MPSAGPPTRVAQLAGLLALAAAFAVQLVAAVLPNVPALIAATSACLAIDLYVQHRFSPLASALSRIRLDATVRQQVRDTLTLIALLRIDGIDATGEVFPLLALVLAGYLTHFAIQALAVVVRRSRSLPVVTRNIDASALNLRPAPPRVLARRGPHRLLRLAVPATAGLLATAATEDVVWGVLGAGLTLALALGGALWLATWLLPGKRPASDEQVIAWLNRWLETYKPTIGLYFSGGQSSAYQANMWLSTLASLDGRPLIVLRERFMVQKIDATDVPIICIPKVAHLMNLEHSTLKVLLHPANSGKTSQVLRIPSIKHAFINHGESDKLSSCNPYAKAYDEVWVAGQAARERYALADIGVDDRDVVEVGRPQLAPIEPYRGAPEGEFTTVLYAPTWEGWTDDPGNTSIILAGENVVRELLADPGVRLLYKPHPMTGSVDPRAGRANERIKAMVAAANARRAAERGRTRPGQQALDELRRRTAELEKVTAVAFRSSADELERMSVQGSPDPERAAALEVATRAWEDAYWASLPEWEHQVITDARPHLFSCFNRADLLISDVSSVVSDFLSSEKPYAVANTSGLSEEQFRHGFPTVRAATVLTPDGKGVPALLESVRDPAEDRFAAARAALKTYLLGPSEPSSLERFDDAALALAARADQRRLRIQARLAAGSEIPLQRAEEPSESADLAEPGELPSESAEQRAEGANGEAETVGVG